MTISCRGWLRLLETRLSALDLSTLAAGIGISRSAHLRLMPARRPRLSRAGASGGRYVYWPMAASP